MKHTRTYTSRTYQSSVWLIFKPTAFWLSSAESVWQHLTQKSWEHWTAQQQESAKLVRADGLAGAPVTTALYPAGLKMAAEKMGSQEPHWHWMDIIRFRPSYDQPHPCDRSERSRWALCCPVRRITLISFRIKAEREITCGWHWQPMVQTEFQTNNTHTCRRVCTDAATHGGPVRYRINLVNLNTLMIKRHCQ